MNLKNPIHNFPPWQILCSCVILIKLKHNIIFHELLWNPLESFNSVHKQALPQLHDKMAQDNQNQLIYQKPRLEVQVKNRNYCSICRTRFIQLPIKIGMNSVTVCSNFGFL